MPRLLPVWIGLAVCLSAPGSPVSGFDQNRPNILLITIDTLRADRLGAYGHKPAATPALDRLAAGGVRFADATAQAPLTLASHAALLTGRLPGAFGIRTNGVGQLPPGTPTLARRLRTAGYATSAIVASAVLDRRFGLSQGFNDYDDRLPMSGRETLSTAELQRRAPVVTAAAQQWLTGRAGPWFLWVHYYDPHQPYEADPSCLARTSGRPYDAEIACVDTAVGRLLDGIDRANTVIVATADHGEALGEHGEPDHGFFLYDATLRVPLIIAAPGIPARVVTAQARGIDVAPTLAELAGVPATAVTPDTGVSLVSLMRGTERLDDPISVAESWYPRLHFGWSELRSARVGEWKYVAAPTPELYDLRVDPGETKNVARDRAAVASRLAAELDRVKAPDAAPSQAPRQPDAETMERLRSLGYLGAFAPVAAGTPAEDPKNHVAAYRQYRTVFNRALGALARGNATAAAADLTTLVKLNVRAFEAHLYLGTARAAQGRRDEALGEFDMAAALHPDLAAPHFEAAKVLSAGSQHAQAVARARRGLALDPESAYGHYTLGVIHQKAAEWREAHAAFGRAVDLSPMDPRARTNLASTSMRLGDFATARVQYLEMIALAHQVAPAHFNLGVIAERQGDRAEAARRYGLALAADPAFKPAQDALAKLKGR